MTEQTEQTGPNLNPQPGPPEQQHPSPTYDQPAENAAKQQEQAKTSGDYVTRSEFRSKIDELNSKIDDQVTVTAPQPDPETTYTTTAAALGVEDPNPFQAEDTNPPEGAVDPHGRSDGSGLATAGNEPPDVDENHKKGGFFRGW